MESLYKNHTILNKNFNLYSRGIAISIIIIMHIYQFLIPQFLQNGIMNYIAVMFAQGSVAIFFFISGYGNYFSIQKNLNINWLFKKIIRFYLTTTPVLLVIWLFRCHFDINILKINDFRIIKDIMLLGLSRGF